MSDALFHLSFPVNDLEETKRFYVNGLGCNQGRESSVALTLALGGHQIVAQLTKESLPQQKGIYPRHFGLVMKSESEWQALADQAKARGLKFFRDPRRRYPGTPLEHLTFFLEDPSHNLLEFKYYIHESAIFGEQAFREVGDEEERKSIDSAGPT